MEKASGLRLIKVGASTPSPSPPTNWHIKKRTKWFILQMLSMILSFLPSFPYQETREIWIAYYTVILSSLLSTTWRATQGKGHEQSLQQSWKDTIVYSPEDARTILSSPSMASSYFPGWLQCNAWEASRNCLRFTNSHLSVRLQNRNWPSTIGLLSFVIPCFCCFGCYGLRFLCFLYLSLGVQCVFYSTEICGINNYSSKLCK